VLNCCNGYSDEYEEEVFFAEAPMNKKRQTLYNNHSSSSVLFGEDVNFLH